MATIKFSGLDEYLQKLQKMEKNTTQMMTEVTYGMANIVADEIRKNINALPAEPDVEALAAYKEKAKAPLTISQKRGLQEGFGISPLQEENGYHHVKLGFDGYNSVKTKKYPQGQPNVMIARATESGSSVREKHPFVRPAVNQARKRAEKRAQEIMDQELKKI